jgi:hypothetical protein
MLTLILDEHEMITAKIKVILKKERHTRTPGPSTHRQIMPDEKGHTLWAFLSAHSGSFSICHSLVSQ